MNMLIIKKYAKKKLWSMGFFLIIISLILTAEQPIKNARSYSKIFFAK